MQLIDWGLTRYSTALERQLTVVEHRIANRCPDTLIFTEHYPVYTLGVHANAAQHLLIPSEEAKNLGIDVVSTRRGGDITYHGPGQLVGYPIIKLQDNDLHAHLRQIEDAIIATLRLWHIPAQRHPRFTGVWVDSKKIAAIGVAVRHKVTYHGFAINLHNDLSPFYHIIPCGIPPSDGGITSLQAILPTPPEDNTLKCILFQNLQKAFPDQTEL